LEGPIGLVVEFPLHQVREDWGLDEEHEGVYATGASSSSPSGRHNTGLRPYGATGS
jgi:hypothetical protein